MIKINPRGSDDAVASIRVRRRVSVILITKIKSPCWHDRGYDYTRMKVNGITLPLKYDNVAQCQGFQAYDITISQTDWNDGITDSAKFYG